MTSVVYILLAGLSGVMAGWWRGAAIPYAVAACALAALIISVTVSLPLDDQGPRLFEVALLPAAAGALAGALIARLMLAWLVRRQHTRS